MKTKFFAFLLIALIGIPLSISLTGCKKDQPAEDQNMEDMEDMDEDFDAGESMEEPEEL